MNNQGHPEALLNVQDLALMLGVSVATVYDWRYRKTGPPGIKVGAQVRYRRREVEDWLDARTDPKTPAGVA